MTSPREPGGLTSPVGSVARALGRLWLWWFGWRLEGELPPLDKAVIIAAPHTSNWDLPFMLAAAYVLRINPAWLGKRELFRWPFGWLMRWLGGIPVDRGARGNVVAQAVARFAAAERLHLVVPPSGTRSRATHWKSGFYQIARGAHAPILCTFLDYRRRVGGIGPTIMPTGDVTYDMAIIRAFYAPIQGKFPDNATPVRLPEEDAPTAARA
jgi:1-acyl-sn-glycerol-3-phosphate acyltransferase